jgi:hypothetical protein
MGNQGRQALAESGERQIGPSQFSVPLEMVEKTEGRADHKRQTHKELAFGPGA